MTTDSSGRRPRMLTFYGRRSSDSVQKALWMLMETGQAFDHIELRGRLAF